MAGETLSAGSTNTQGLADWAAPYITGYLGQAQALSNTPYEAYKGPLTSGPSQLQSNVFSGLAGLTVPQNLGQSFASPAGGTQGAALTGMGTMGQTGMFGGSDFVGQPAVPPTSQQPSNIAQTYMNPYLQSVLNPQLDELRRQNDITNMKTNAGLTSQGAFGGGRQAIMNAENNRNLMMEQNKTVGQGYANAYDKAMGQFNTEQGQSRDLVNLLAGQGATQRNIDAEGVAADLGEFEKQRQFPYQQVQFQRDMISGLPTGSVTNTPGQMSGIGSLLSVLGGGTAAASALGYKDVGELLSSLGLNLGQKK
jgi:hypothetical protein